MTSIRLLFTMLPLCGCMCSFGCSKPVTVAELAGVYEASRAVGSEVLELKPGGEYALHFKDAKGVESIETGPWKFEPFEGEPKVAVQNFSSNLPNFPSQRDGIVLLGIGRSWGTIRLYASYSPDEYYSKRKTNE